MHAGNDRFAPLCVEYTFLGACLGHVPGIVLQAIFEREDLKVPQKVAVAQALGKILWIQNDLSMRWQLPQDTISTGAHTRAHIAREPEPYNPSKPCSFLPDSSPLRLLRLTGTADGCENPPISQKIHEPVERMRMVHVERLHDGSLELLLSPAGVTALQHEIERSRLAARFELDYDPWKPHKEAVEYVGLDVVRAMFGKWTSMRARRPASVCDGTGYFYRNLLQSHSVR